MIFSRHRCDTNLGIPRIVSAKYEVILSLTTMVILFDKTHQEEENNFKIHILKNIKDISPMFGSRDPQNRI